MRKISKNVILLATYNGEEYLPSQLKSLQSQTLSDWTLLVRDDGSIDCTVAVIREFEQQDARIRLVSDTLGNLGSNRSFLHLLRLAVASGAQYVWFCDQDDVWLECKLSDQLEHIKLLEHKHGVDLPLLVYSDLEVVDANLRTIAQSFMSFQGLRPVPTERALALLLNQNLVTGCALLMNRALCVYALPIQIEGILMHDWWVALVAASTGRVEYMPKTLLRYRQHGRNQVGAKGYSLRWILAPRALRAKLELGDRHFFGTFRQAIVLKSHLDSGGTLSPVSKQCIQRFVDVPAWPLYKRLFALVNGTLARQGLIRLMLLATRVVFRMKASSN
jgi:glycosyltransferase involved in cell wall biosynthesis